MKNKLMRKLTSLALAVAMTATLIQIPSDSVHAESVKAHSVRELTPINDISYQESLEETLNPYRGFYKSVQISYTKGNDNSSKNFTSYKDKLVHLRIDLSDFAAHPGINDGHESDVNIDSQTTNMQAALKTTLQNLRNNNTTAVVRIAYDNHYSGYTKDTWVKDDKGNDVLMKRSVWEPQIKTVLQHQQAVGEIFAQFPDVIASVECGVFGPWGEMHSSQIMSDNNLKLVIDKWLEVLPESMTVTVRQPEHYCKWSGVPVASIQENVTAPGTLEYRVGVFNDGYLGSYDDRGTFRNRTKEVAWLENQAKHTLYGGEIVLWESDPKHPSEELNNAVYMEKEGFKTHTSYLNIGWNDNVIQDMRDTTFKGTDPLYSGAGVSEFTYVQNHLGYRYVVRNVKLTKETTKYENFALEADIENVGFANLIMEKKAYLIIKGTDSATSAYEKAYDLSSLDASLKESSENADPRDWDSAATTVLKANVDIPDDFPSGAYQVYIKLVTDTENHPEYCELPIRFSNEDAKIYDSELRANFLGTFNIVEGELEVDQNKNETGTNGLGESSTSGSGSTSKGSNNSSASGTGSSGSASNQKGSGSAGGTSGQTGDSTQKYSSEWVNGKWYNSDGTQNYEGTLQWKCNATGWWVEDTSGWYPISQWQKIDGKWYYFLDSGYMDYSEYRDGCWLGSDGSWVEEYYGGHWSSDSNGWWYEDSAGWYPQSQWLWIDGTEYYFKEDGYMK